MKKNMKRLLNDFPNELRNSTASVFLGAGTSMAAGYPSWGNLLREIGDELNVPTENIQDLAALAQWSIQENGNDTRVKNLIKKEISAEREIPDSIKTISRFPLKHIWTTNYDTLIERSFNELRKPIDVISLDTDFQTRSTPGATQLYKMHGTIGNTNSIVISTEHYELFAKNRRLFIPLFHSHMYSMTFLFVGLSFSDPNIKHVLSLIKQNFENSPPEHFAILRPPKIDDFKTKDEYDFKKTIHKLWTNDLKRYGLVTVEIDNYDEVPDLLSDIERRVAANKVWISGSWPLDTSNQEASSIYNLTEKIGEWLAHTDRCLVSGGGILVGSASVSGFMEGLRKTGNWDLDRKLITRPFPQAFDVDTNIKNQWTELRRELSKHSGTVIFIGGKKISNGEEIIADGVLEEFTICQNNGVFMIPIGSTGGAAKIINEKLHGSQLSWDGKNSLRPTDKELEELNNGNIDIDYIINLLKIILDRNNKK